MRSCLRVLAITAMVAGLFVFVGPKPASATACSATAQGWVKLKASVTWNRYFEIYNPGGGPPTETFLGTYGPYGSTSSASSPLRDDYLLTLCGTGKSPYTWQVVPSQSYVDPYYVNMSSSLSATDNPAFGMVSHQVNSNSLVIYPTLCKRDDGGGLVSAVLSLPFPGVPYWFSVLGYLIGSNPVPASTHCDKLGSVTFPLTLSASGAGITGGTLIYYRYPPAGAYSICTAPATCKFIDEYVWHFA